MGASASAIPSAPHAFELRADASWTCIDFLSDLHLQASLPRTFDAFSRHLLGTPAQAVIILGDLFEAWAGDDSAESGFEHECSEVLREAARQRDVFFMVGNRDFLVGQEFLQSLGVGHLPDPTVLLAFGQRILLTHGDALCLDDREYQAFRAQVRNPEWQRSFLRLPLPQRRAIASQVRAESQQRGQALTPQDYADLDSPAARQWLHAAGAQRMIHGHTHRPADHEFAPGVLRHVLSDWDLDREHPGHPLRAEIMRLTPHGLARIDLASRDLSPQAKR